MKAYLFGWNPVKFKWENLDEDIKTLLETGNLEDNWSVASYKAIKPGDRAYIVRVGMEPRGIFASGFVSSEPYTAIKKGRTHHRVKIKLDVLLNPDKEPILNLDILKSGNLAEQMWTPQGSGISIRPQLVDEVESVWLGFLSDNPNYSF
jgi:hypothetical protein